MSYCVRWRRRCDSSCLPSDSSSAERLVQLGADRLHRGLDRPFLDVVVRGRPDRDVLEIVREQLARQRVEVLQPFDFVAEHRGPEGRLGVRREDLERLAPDPERAAREHAVVAVVLDRDELAQQRVAVDLLAALEDLHVHLVRLRRAQAVDARDRRDHDHVAAREHGCRRGVAQPVDLLVDRGVLLDVEVAARDVGLGLVVVVVGDEVLDGVVGEEGPELVAELGRERLVVGDHERRALHRLDHPRHRHRLAGAGGAEQRLEALAGDDALRHRLDRPRLVCGGREDAVELEGRHRTTVATVAASRRPQSAPATRSPAPAGRCCGIPAARPSPAARIPASR